ncbi:MAG TPA: helix-turn-helix domain-containing protein [Caulobacteraceae bacterium]|nr:helix-turn-helix domain-containing protein [Caulobacteraceae bacterium]
MSIDAVHGFAYVMCRYDPTLLGKPLSDRWELATSPAVIALTRNEPVYIRDARESEEFPGYRREAFERDYRTVLVVPMSCLDDEGRPMVMSVISRHLKDVSEDELAFIGLIVHLGEIAVEKQHRLLEERRAGERLQSALEGHTSFLNQALSGAPVASLAAAIERLLPNPLVVVDFSTNSVVAGRSPSQAHFDDEAWRGAVDTALHRPLIKAARAALDQPREAPETLVLESGPHRLLVAPKIEPLTVDGEAVGALMIFPTQREFSDLDLLLLESARFALSVQLMRSFVRFRFETRTLSELFREIVERRWRDVEDVLQRAQRLGLNLANPRQMLVVELPSGAGDPRWSAVDLHHVAARLMEQNGLSAATLVHESSLVCLVACEDARAAGRLDKVLPRLASEVTRYFGQPPIVLLSERCASVTDYATAWERCRRRIRIAQSFGSTGVLSNQDFGPLPMLVTAADAADVRSFVQESVGVIAAHDREHGTPYLETLCTYLREGCRSQACANALDLHVTTLRYRLTRIQELFGIDVETPERRFAVELAIHLHDVINLDAR